jgi:ATP-dependent protease Clp ATPase subunit
MEQFMMKLMYELPSDELADTVTITRAFIKGEAEAIITHCTLALPEAAEETAAMEAAEIPALPEATEE